jgi:molybdopterin molybdotransferase
MTTVEEAEKIILAQLRDHGVETVPFELGLNRVLAEDIKADRDLPPFNRVTMDGIAIAYGAIEQGITTFRVKATQPAGEEPIAIDTPDECIEIMTGAALSRSVDAIIRYEDLEIKEGTAKLLITDIKHGQNIHQKGKDKKKGDTGLVNVFLC